MTTKKGKHSYSAKVQAKTYKNGFLWKEDLNGKRGRGPPTTILWEDNIK